MSDKLDSSILQKIEKLKKELEIEGDDRERVKKILPLAEEILEIDPLNFDALYAKAISFLILEDYEEVLYQCDEILKLFPQAFFIYDLKALILKILGKTQESNEVLQVLMQMKEQPASFEGFLMEKSKVILRIIDPNIMLLHQQWVWNVKNISTNTLDTLHFLYEGDVPREIENLNFRARDNFENDLDVEIQLNYPQRKLLSIFLKEPILSGNRGGPYFLDFDWESPKRAEYHLVEPGVSEFSYEIHIPKKYDWNPKISEVNEHLEENPVDDQLIKQTAGEYNLFFWKTNEPKENKQYKIEW